MSTEPYHRNTYKSRSHVVHERATVADLRRTAHSQRHRRHIAWPHRIESVAAAMDHRIHRSKEVSSNKWKLRKVDGLLTRETY